MNNRLVVKLSCGKRLMLSFAAIVAVVAPIVIGVMNAPSIQAQGQSVAFEVATVKPAGTAFGGFIQMPPNGMFMVRSMSLKDLFVFAYGVHRDFVKGGPKWFESEGWEVVAKPAGESIPSIEQRKEMLKKLLAERFKLTIHRETKEGAYYALVLAKTGLKMKRRTPEDGGAPFSLVFRGPNLPGRDVPMNKLAEVLQLSLFDQPVLDKTGLDGTWDFDLIWAPDETQFGGRYRDANPNPNAPTFNTALQEQLGLRVEKQKGPIDVIVVDHAERPDAN